MNAGHSNPQSLSFSTRDLPEKERVPYWREVFGRHVIRVDFTPQSEARFEAEASLWAVPGLRAHWSVYRGAARLRRTKELISQTDEDVALLIDRKGSLRWSQRGAEVQLARSGAVLVLHSEPAEMIFPSADYMAIMAPLRAIAPLTRCVEERRYIPAGTEALALLPPYLRMLRGLSDPQVIERSVSYVYDLMALALGATREAAVIANARGMRAARLHAVKADIAANLTSRDLSVAAVALRQRVTPRYIHMLFDGEGTTFSQFVLGGRLAHAHRSLLDPCHAHQSIGEIAYASGFGDLSHFNHVFRRRYGATPSEVRREQAEQKIAAGKLS
jgi:AraC-like DNA-binding protein